MTATDVPPQTESDRLAAQVTARVRWLLDTCPACAERAEQAERDAARRREAAALLTPRQVEVLQLSAEGLTVEQIARRLWISMSTTKSHQTAIREVLGVHNMTKAVADAIRLGIID